MDAEQMERSRCSLHLAESSARLYADGNRREARGSMPARRILSIDGGGMPVLMSLLLLRRIERARPGFLAAVDLFAGTSAGAISAIILASDKDPMVGLERAIQFWERTPILSPQARHLIRGSVGARSLYSHDRLRGALLSVIGHRYMRDLPRQVMVAAIQLDNEASNHEERHWEPRTMGNTRGEQPEVLDTLAVDIALRSGAAPIVWPIYQGYVDGGLFANDPSMLALSRVLREWQQDSSDHGNARPALEDICLFSVGEGQNPHYIPVKNAAWGYLQWLFRPQLPAALVELALNSTGDEICEQCRLLLGDEQYYRLNPDSKVRVPQVKRETLWSTLSNLRRDISQEQHDPLAEAREKAAALGESYDITGALAWIDQSSWFATTETATPCAT